MEKIIQWMAKTFKGFLKVLLFLISCLIILYFFPREGKFPYEFQKGKPWGHETKYADFDFSIYKTTEELNAEKDSVLKDFKPYFNLDKNIGKQNVDNFAAFFELQWKKYFKKDTFTETPKIKHKLRQKEITYFKDSCYSLLVNLLEDIYSNGIIDINSTGYQLINEYLSIIKIDNNVGIETNSHLINTPRSAYEYINNFAIEAFSSEGLLKYSFAIEFIDKLNLNNFIKPNLFFDETKTHDEKEALLNSISLTYGMVQKGQTIINQGEIVNNENLKILESLKIEYQKKLGDTNFYLILAGQFVLLAVSLLVLFLFLWNFRKEVLESSVKLTFILVLFTLITVISVLTIKHNWANLYIVPFAIVPIIIWTFFDARLALFIHIIVIMVIGFFAPNSFEFVFLNFISGIVAIFSLKNLYRRGKLFLTAGLLILTYCLVYFGISITQEGSFNEINWDNFGWFGLNGALILTSYPLIYLFEKGFGFLSDNTLMELSDTNHPLLRQLAENAPGTFQHSLQVANLAEGAVIEIGGNPLLVRAGALYHDIGKIEEPVYFTENQRTGFNPHEELDFEKSAKKIIEHISLGVRIAKKYNIPNQIIDFIKTHQGTGKVEYFYRLHKNKYPGKEKETKNFSYPGPLPFSKETAVLMMADSIEAASRSIKEPTEISINELVENIINKQINERQFDYADITFKDITNIKKVFKRKLLNIYHVRVEYPLDV